MRKYQINDKEVLLADWKKAFSENPDAIVMLKTAKKTALYEPPAFRQSISPERAKELRQKWASR